MGVCLVFGLLSALSVFIQQFSFLVSYVKNQAFPQPLTEAEEEQCLLEMAEGGAKARAARNRLIEHNLRLVAHVVKKFEKTRDDSEDLISIGTIGLIKAIESYSANKGTKLATYAARCVENEILMHLRANKKSARDVSIYDSVGQDKEGNDFTLLDLLSTEADEVESTVMTRLDTSKLSGYLDLLDEREREVIMARYGLAEDERTQRDIAKELGISRSYVSRIEKRALMKLYQHFIKHKQSK
jgi:RNA polymerase sporulation-specific sigma factor